MWYGASAERSTKRSGSGKDSPVTLQAVHFGSFLYISPHRSSISPNPTECQYLYLTSLIANGQWLHINQSHVKPPRLNETGIWRCGRRLISLLQNYFGRHSLIDPWSADQAEILDHLHRFSTICAPCSAYSSLLTHIWWKLPRLPNTLPPTKAPYLRSTLFALARTRTRGFGYMAWMSDCKRSGSLSMREPAPVRMMLFKKWGRVSTSQAMMARLTRDGMVWSEGGVG